MSIPFTQLDKLYIAGQWVAVRDTEAVLNPATEAVIGHAPLGDHSSADAAIDAARQAFDRGPWPQLSTFERAGYLRRLHAELVTERDAIAALIIAEVGCSQGVTYGMQVDMPLRHVLTAIDQSLSDQPRPIATQTAVNPFNPGGPLLLGSGSIEREPIGVVAGITGYNFPFLLNLAKIFPALLAGNTLVLKPSPFTPYSALLFGQLAERIGLPAGVLNIVTGGPQVGAMLSTDPRVDMVSFTGSEAVGISIMSQASATLKRVHLELGGKSALIVRADADIQTAGMAAVGGLTVNAGQGCALLTRFVVHESIRSAFIQTAQAIASQIKIGDPSDPTVMMGPLIRESQRAKVQGFIDRGRDSGATLVCGGGRPAHLSQGYFSDITLFDDVRNDMEIAQEEIFGPVGVTIGFDTDEEALSIANDSRFGLNGGVYTADAAVGLDMARRIRAGSVYLNGGGGQMPYAPIGGYKRSGIGREFGPDWLKEFTQEKSIIYPIGR
ncbi:aldehyde dehydrogenase family protein [Pseudomonas sp. LP_7_YM]|uniref:aldehyde dehydrogenase family protein n=1 Tax=Pseudomonas sp. LP_7_YM TaxID=2485137 RepID=UPI00105C890D|nr:aldehyde dehydrogenase family protein [Pseudomonas sp. LP_7_YM]TDV72646.1 acyl-CoA reductase-like NAD-dependent aldehyde dehydrogenase [Pseudomonas sp. LP_7_YM]